MTIDIPGRGILELDTVVLDFNGTLAVDGKVNLSVEALLYDLARQYETILATADTFGTASYFAHRLGLRLEVVQSGLDKETLVTGIPGGVAAIGNGANDQKMFRAADLAIGIIGAEGASVTSMLEADIWVASAEHALELLLHPNRLVATLRT